MNSFEEELKEFEYLQEEGYEYCNHCDWKNINDECLPEEGAPISGTYYVCPKCGKYWEFNKKITNQIPMIRIEKEKLMVLKDKFCFDRERVKEAIEKHIVSCCYCGCTYNKEKLLKELGL